MHHTSSRSPSRRLRHLAVSALALLAVLLAAPAGAASTDDWAGKLYYYGHGGGMPCPMVLRSDLTRSSTDRLTLGQDCGGVYDSAALFHLAPTANAQSSSEAEVHIQADGNCLDIQGDQDPYHSNLPNGVPVQSYWCDSAYYPDSNAQHWIFRSVALVSGLQGWSGGWCLDVPNQSFRAGQALQLARCAPRTGADWAKSEGQRFTWEQQTGRIRVAPSYYSVPSLCVQGGYYAHDTVKLATCRDGEPRQQWVPGYGGFALRNSVDSGRPLCLDVVNGTAAAGAGIQVYDCWSPAGGNFAQQWGFLGQIVSQYKSIGAACLAPVNDSSRGGLVPAMVTCPSGAEYEWRLMMPTGAPRY